MYSHFDPITDGRRIEVVMNTWREQGATVSCSVFDDSEHVMHMRRYFDDYKRDFDAFVSPKLQAHLPTQH
jgi:hypothetical protein